MMAQLYKFRQGWQSENLARFLLSHFSFIAQPSTVADDVGSDFYCTLFKKEAAGSNHHLIPKNSFVIQIKSSADVIDLSDKASFLNQIELPYFVGIADRRNMKLQIYSGRALQLIFTMKGIPNKLLIKLVPSIVDRIYYKIADEQNKHYDLNFPLIAEVCGQDLEWQADQIYSRMAAECALIHQNIASRRMDEFILTFDQADTRIFAGPASAERFRRNFSYRLAEVFYNIEWILQNVPARFSQDEYSKYAEFWKEIRQYISEPEKAAIEEIYDRLGKAVEAFRKQDSPRASRAAERPH